MADECDSLSLEQKSKLILESRKNSNFLVDLLEALESNKTEEVSEAIACLERVFKVFIARRVWHEKLEDRPVTVDESEEGQGEQNGDRKSNGAVKNADSVSNEDAEKIFAEWLHDKYLLFVKTLLQLVSRSKKDAQKRSLDCLMRMLLAEHKAKLGNQNHDSTKSYFPNTLFARLTSKIIVGECSNRTSLLKYFHKYLVYNDIQFYMLKNICKIINTKLGKKESTKNVICSLLLKITSGKDGEEDDKKLFISNQPEDRMKFFWESKEKLKLFSDTWLSLLQTQLPHESLKKVLLNLHERIMPYMDDPKLLIDFLTDAYDMEGPVSLLALNGLFILIQQYNLDYPDFFKKLYRLLDAKVFDLKYRSRFFILTDLFLTSSNLPSYMVAAFAKRLARLSLQASPDGIKIILTLIENLMKRHPTCRVLIHRKQANAQDGQSDDATDPYNHDEDDPSKCNALKSSLWELKTLEQHYHPDIQEAVKVFQKPFTKEEKEIAEFVEGTYGDLFAEELVAYAEEEVVPLAFKPHSLLFDKTAYEDDIWAIG